MLLVSPLAPIHQDILPRVAQERPTATRGGGTLTVDGAALAFRPGRLLLSPGNSKLGRAIRLTGTLHPDRGAPWTFDLQVTEQGTILLLQFFRKEHGHETGRWSPTLASKVEVLDFRPEPGGTVRLKFSGPLSGAAKASSWAGELWASPE